MWEREGKVRGKGGREEEGDCLLLCGVAPGEGYGGTEGRRVGRLVVVVGGAACCCAASPQVRCVCSTVVNTCRHYIYILYACMYAYGAS